MRETEGRDRPPAWVGQAEGVDGQRLAHLAAAVETAAQSLIAVLEAAGGTGQVAVSPTQLRVLMVVQGSPRVNVNRLAEALNVVPSSASRLCDRLEALGLLRRTADPNNRREVQLSLTAVAVQMLDDLGRRRRQAVQAVLGRMSDATRRELVRSLTAFMLAAAEPSPGADGQRSA